MNTVLLNMAESVGTFVRDSREKQGTTQKEIAELAKISVSMLSQIERGVTAPSLDTLMHLCGALDIELSELFASLEEKSSVTITNRANRFVHKESGVTFEEVIHYISPKIAREFFILSLDPGAYVTIDARHKIGREVQMGVVLTGNAVLTVDDDIYEVNSGDVVSFKAKLRLRLSNHPRVSFTLPKKCTILWMCTPPRRDTMVFGRVD